MWSCEGSNGPLFLEPISYWKLYFPLVVSGNCMGFRGSARLSSSFLPAVWSVMRACTPRLDIGSGFFLNDGILLKDGLFLGDVLFLCDSLFLQVSPVEDPLRVILLAACRDPQTFSWVLQEDICLSDIYPMTRLVLTMLGLWVSGNICV